MRYPIYLGNCMECLMEFYTILYENEFQNPQIFQQTISPFPEHSTLAVVAKLKPVNLYIDVTFLGCYC
jgi:hypothetical protein